MGENLLVFPLRNRLGKIRATAQKMMAKTTDRHAAYYRDQVTGPLSAHLEKLGLSESERERELATFWHAVQSEIIARCRHDWRPEGAA